jgi:DNA-binding NarL/FixJ family response regulator
VNGRTGNKVIRLTAGRRAARTAAPKAPLNPLPAADSPPATAIRILLGDSEVLFRLGLKKLLDAERDLLVVAQTADRDELIRLAAESKADVVFAQAELLGVHFEETISELRHAAPGTKLMVVASSFPDEDAVSAVRAGASGVILKSTDPALFLRCARKVYENEVWLPKKQVAQMATLLQNGAGSPRPADTLTPREKVIISYLTHGWRNREIAHSLSITEQTVKNHLRNIYDKIGVSDRVELVLYAIHQHLELPRVNLVEPVAS